MTEHDKQWLADQSNKRNITPDEMLSIALRDWQSSTVAQAKLDAFKEALTIVMGPHNRESLQMVERVTAALLARDYRDGE